MATAQQKQQLQALVDEYNGKIQQQTYANINQFDPNRGGMGGFGEEATAKYANEFITKVQGLGIPLYELKADQGLGGLSIVNVGSTRLQEAVNKSVFSSLGISELNGQFKTGGDTGSYGVTFVPSKDSAFDRVMTGLATAALTIAGGAALGPAGVGLSSAVSGGLASAATTLATGGSTEDALKSGLTSFAANNIGQAVSGTTGGVTSKITDGIDKAANAAGITLSEAAKQGLTNGVITGLTTGDAEKALVAAASGYGQTSLTESMLGTKDATLGVDEAAIARKNQMDALNEYAAQAETGMQQTAQINQGVKDYLSNLDTTLSATSLFGNPSEQAIADMYRQGQINANLNQTLGTYDPTTTATGLFGAAPTLDLKGLNLDQIQKNWENQQYVNSIQAAKDFDELNFDLAHQKPADFKTTALEADGTVSTQYYYDSNGVAKPYPWIAEDPYRVEATLNQANNILEGRLVNAADTPQRLSQGTSDFGTVYPTVETKIADIIPASDLTTAEPPIVNQGQLPTDVAPTTQLDLTIPAIDTTVDTTVKPTYDVSYEANKIVKPETTLDTKDSLFGQLTFAGTEPTKDTNLFKPEDTVASSIVGTILDGAVTGVKKEDIDKVVVPSSKPEQPKTTPTEETPSKQQQQQETPTKDGMFTLGGASSQAQESLKSALESMLNGGTALGPKMTTEGATGAVSDVVTPTGTVQQGDQTTVDKGTGSATGTQGASKDGLTRVGDIGAAQAATAIFNHFKDTFGNNPTGSQLDYYLNKMTQGNLPLEQVQKEITNNKAAMDAVAQQQQQQQPQGQPEDILGDPFGSTIEDNPLDSLVDTPVEDGGTQGPQQPTDQQPIVEPERPQPPVGPQDTIDIPSAPSKIIGDEGPSTTKEPMVGVNVSKVVDVPAAPVDKVGDGPAIVDNGLIGDNTGTIDDGTGGGTSDVTLPTTYGGLLSSGGSGFTPSPITGGLDWRTTQVLQQLTLPQQQDFLAALLQRLRA